MTEHRPRQQRARLKTCLYVALFGPGDDGGEAPSDELAAAETNGEWPDGEHEG